MLQVEYEAWKLREMKRLKRDREEAEAVAKEQAELERLRNLTEEERRFFIIRLKFIKLKVYHAFLQDGAAEEPQASDQQGGQGKIQIPAEILPQVGKPSILESTS